VSPGAAADTRVLACRALDATENIKKFTATGMAGCERARPTIYCVAL